MTLSIDVSPDVEARLKETAARLGVGAAEYAKWLIEQNLPQTASPEAAPNPNQGTLDLLARWSAEDATADPEEVGRRSREFDELKEAMNRNRIESGGPGARKVFP